MFPAHAAVSAPDPRLEVSKDPVDPWEQYRGRFRHSLRRRPMIIPALLERGIALPAVRPDRAPGATTVSPNPTRDGPDTSGTVPSRIRPVPRPRTSTAATSIDFRLSRHRQPALPSSAPPSCMTHAVSYRPRPSCRWSCRAENPGECAVTR
jgi:hypothetical protein